METTPATPSPRTRAWARLRRPDTQTLRQIVWLGVVSFIAFVAVNH